jgi:hypothetical protein
MKLEVGDVDQWPFGVSLDGQRGERGSNIFSRRVNILRFVVDQLGDFERSILELKLQSGKKGKIV